MSRGFLQGHQRLAQKQRLRSPSTSLSTSDENSCAAGESGARAGGSNQQERQAPSQRGLEASVRLDMVGRESIQDPWRTHLAIHRLRHSTCWAAPSLPKAGQPASDPRMPTQEGTNGQVPPSQDPQEPSRPAVTPAPVGPRGGDYYPFPKRKAPRVSEAARRLGLYRPT